MYKRAYLHSHKSFEETQQVHQALIQALIDDQHLTLAEAKYIGPVLMASYAKDETALDLLKKAYVQLGDFHFWDTYMRYAEDLEGWGDIKDFYGSVPVEQKRNEADFLEKHFQQWRPVIENTDHKNEALQFLATEARAELKEQQAYSKQLGEGSNRQKYITKTVVLHSRFVYIKVKEYYQEIKTKEESTTMCGQLILFNSFTYAHILMRHYAPKVKFNRPGKTYHDENIDLENLPRHVMFFLDAYEKTLGCAYFNNRSIFFEYKNRNYVIWFAKKSRDLKNQQVQEYLRVQTFYPAELLKDSQQIAALQKIEANPMLSFYY